MKDALILIGLFVLSIPLGVLYEKLRRNLRG